MRASIHHMHHIADLRVEERELGSLQTYGFWMRRTNSLRKKGTEYIIRNYLEITAF
jgi:hypothetical protein